MQFPLSGAQGGPPWGTIRLVAITSDGTSIRATSSGEIGISAFGGNAVRSQYQIPTKWQVYTSRAGLDG